MAGPAAPSFAQLRPRLLANLGDLASQATAVLNAMATVPREAFVPEPLRARAYEDCPLDIGAGQTISQPTVVAHMLSSLQLSPGDRVLEVGTGSGYQAALLHRLGCEVYTLEVREQLARSARQTLARLAMGPVQVRVGDASKGWPEAAPFAAIVVACAAVRIPDALLDQLVDGGYLVMPVGRPNQPQQLERWQRRGEAFRQETLGAVRFVPWTSHKMLQAEAPGPGS